MSERLSGGDLWDKETKPKRDKVKLLKATGSGTTGSIRSALGKTSRNPTPPEYWVEGEEVRDEPEPESVDDETQGIITIGANLKDAERLWEQGEFAQARVMAHHLLKRQRRATKYGLDFGPRILALLKEMDAELADKRRDAA
jgi:hypothetical protein